MSSSVKASPSHNITIEIPPELVQSGKTFLIEKHSELFVDGCHISKPAKFVRQSHGLCLVDTQEQDQKRLNALHQLEDTIEDDELVQVVIEVPTETLNDGKTITIGKGSTITGSNKEEEEEEEKMSDNFLDLYNVNHLSSVKMINIIIPEESLKSGKIVFIQKDNVSVLKIHDHHKSHHLNDNQFTKRDHLQSKNMIEVTIEVEPQFFNHGQTITFKKEELQTIAGHFFNRRPSRSEIDQQQIINKVNDQRLSIQDILSNETWNPILLENDRLLQLTLQFNNRTDILREDQIKIIINGQNLCVEILDQQGWNIYQQITLPLTTKLNQFKSQFDERHHCLHINIPFH